MGSILIRNIRILYQTDDGTRTLVRGKEMQSVPFIENAWLLLDKGLIQAYGPMSTCPERADEMIDATDRLVLPAFCDSHTHLVFAKSREEEFVMRIKGRSYEEIAASGGGILNSARRLQETDASALLDSALQRLEEIRSFGTGAVEIKSGYGLSLESELKILRVVRELKEQSNLLIRATFLGAHAIPVAYKQNREAYIRLVTDEMIPAVAAEGLADYCDVFCEQGFFTPEETDRILEAGWKYQLKPRIHANQLAVSGGVQAGVRNHAVSVDHLENITEAEINCLLDSNTLPTALPSCSFFLNLPYAPGRAMIDAGLPLVLASDYNPGSTPSGNIPFLLSLACIKMRLTPEEAINAVTVNGAAAMEWSDRIGSIAPGKEARVIITRPMERIDYLPYAFGGRHIERTILPS
jgi:imidazolonepropionase